MKKIVKIKQNWRNSKKENEMHAKMKRNSELNNSSKFKPNAMFNRKYKHDYCVGVTHCAHKQEMEIIV